MGAPTEIANIPANHCTLREAFDKPKNLRMRFVHPQVFNFTLG